MLNCSGRSWSSRAVNEKGPQLWPCHFTARTCQLDDRGGVLPVFAPIVGSRSEVQRARRQDDGSLLALPGPAIQMVRPRSVGFVAARLNPTYELNGSATQCWLRCAPQPNLRTEWFGHATLGFVAARLNPTYELNGSATRRWASLLRASTQPTGWDGRFVGALRAPGTLCYSCRCAQCLAMAEFRPR